MMMDENVKKFLEEYSKKAEEDMHMFFEQMKKESLNQHEVKLSKSRYYNLSKMNLTLFILTPPPRKSRIFNALEIICI